MYGCKVVNFDGYGSYSASDGYGLKIAKAIKRALPGPVRRLKPAKFLKRATGSKSVLEAALKVGAVAGGGYLLANPALASSLLSSASAGIGAVASGAASIGKTVAPLLATSLLQGGTSEEISIDAGIQSTDFSVLTSPPIGQQYPPQQYPQPQYPQQQYPHQQIPPKTGVYKEGGENVIVIKESDLRKYLPYIAIALLLLRK
jgi:hypothetical protein